MSENLKTCVGHQILNQVSSIRRVVWSQ